MPFYLDNSIYYATFAQSQIILMTMATMQRKFAKTETATTEAPSFLDMQGILKGCGSHADDRQLLDEYLEEKYQRMTIFCDTRSESWKFQV